MGALKIVGISVVWSHDAFMTVSRFSKIGDVLWWGHDYLGYDQTYCIYAYLSGDF